MDEEAPMVCLCSKLVHALMFVGRCCSCRLWAVLRGHALLPHLLDLQCSRSLGWACGRMPDCGWPAVACCASGTIADPAPLYGNLVGVCGSMIDFGQPAAGAWQSHHPLSWLVCAHGDSYRQGGDHSGGRHPVGPDLWARWPACACVVSSCCCQVAWSALLIAYFLTGTVLCLLYRLEPQLQFSCSGPVTTFSPEQVNPTSGCKEYNGEVLTRCRAIADVARGGQILISHKAFLVSTLQ